MANAVTLTRELAFASGEDAGNKSMRDGGRTSWNEDDQAAATAKTNTLLLYVPAEQGGLKGFALSFGSLAELGIPLDAARRAGIPIIGDNQGPVLADCRGEAS